MHVHVAIVFVFESLLPNQLNLSAWSHRTYGSFTLETILATAFGRAVNVQGGESDELTKATEAIFRSAEEGSSTGFVHLLLLISKLLSS